MLLRRSVSALNPKRSIYQLYLALAGQEYLLPAGLTLLAVALRLHLLGAAPLWGDEYNSIREAHQLGLNLNSLPYFLLLRLALTGGASTEFWLRLPAAIFGALTVPVAYLLGRELLGSRRHGVLVALLVTTSAYLVEYAQQVRFYSLFLFSAALAFLAYIFYFRYGYTRLRLGGLIIANLFCLSTHALGFLVPLTQLGSHWLTKTNQPQRRRALFLAGLGLFLSLPFLLPQAWLTEPFLFLDKYQAGYAGIAAYSGPRGLNPATLAKIPLTFFFYTFGQSVYPLNYWLVLPGLLLYGYLVLRGLWTLRGQQAVLTLLLVWLGLPLTLLFIGFDAWVQAGFVGADSKYIIYVSLALYLVMAQGILSHRRQAVLLTLLAITVNLISLSFYYNPAWSYPARLTDWRKLAGLVYSQEGNRTIVLHDGRSAAPVATYLPAHLLTQNLWAYAEGEALTNLSQVDRLLFVSYNVDQNHRRSFNQVLQKIETEFTYQEGYVDYPLFAYVYRRAASNGYTVDPATGVVTLPKHIYDLALADLKLPQSAYYGGKTIPLSGAFALSPQLQLEKQTIPLQGGVPSRGFLLLSHLIEAENLPAGTPVAEITIHAAEGPSQRFKLRKDLETGHWLTPCPLQLKEPHHCQVAYSWPKRAALLGRQAYEGAWQDTTANIFGAAFHFSQPLKPQTVEIRYLAAQGTLYLWGLAFETD